MEGSIIAYKSTFKTNFIKYLLNLIKTFWRKTPQWLIWKKFTGNNSEPIITKYFYLEDRFTKQDYTEKNLPIS